MIVTNNHIVFKKAEQKDIHFIREIENRPENSAFILAWTHEQYEDAIKDSNKLVAIVEDVDGKKIGFIILSGISSPHQSIELVRIIIHEKGYGFGQSAMNLVKQLAFTKLKAHRLWLDVKEFNLRAKHVYEKAGFSVEGKLRDCLYINGKYESLYIMSILRDEYDFML